MEDKNIIPEHILEAPQPIDSQDVVESINLVEHQADSEIPVEETTEVLEETFEEPPTTEI